MNRSILAPLLGCIAVALLGTACDDKKGDKSTTVVDGGASVDRYATADTKLEKALQAAASASPSGENGPPPNGVFGPGTADKKHPKGVPTTLEVVSDGSEPRVSLGGTAQDAVLASSYGPAVIEVAMQLGPRMALPTTDMALSVGAAKKDDGGSDWLVAEVKQASAAKEQMGALPDGTDKQLASLEGTQLRLKVGPDGAQADQQVQPGKTSRPEVARLAASAAEALVYATVPLPSKPVGVGAQWIAETRMPLSGLDVIAYRAYRVKSVQGNRLHLTVDVKAYATSTDAQVQGLPKGATLEQFDAAAQGEMELVRGEFLARKSDVQQRVVMIFNAPGGAPQQEPTQPGEPPPPQANTLTAQMQSTATFVRGEDLRAALRH